MKHAAQTRRWSPPQSAFAGFRFPAEVIVVAVRWYLRYGLSYRDVEELLAERGVTVDHVTIYRWVQRFTPLLIDAARPRRHATGDGAVAFAEGKTCSTLGTPCLDGEGELGEGRGEPMSGIDVKAEFVVAAAQVLDECVSGADDADRAEPF